MVEKGVIHGWFAKEESPVCALEFCGHTPAATTREETGEGKETQLNSQGWTSLNFVAVKRACSVSSCGAVALKSWSQPVNSLRTYVSPTRETPRRFNKESGSFWTACITPPMEDIMVRWGLIRGECSGRRLIVSLNRITNCEQKSRWANQNSVAWIVRPEVTRDELLELMAGVAGKSFCPLDKLLRRDIASNSLPPLGSQNPWYKILFSVPHLRRHYTHYQALTRNKRYK